MINSLYEHRSVRKYKSDEIPFDLLNELLNMACRASNTGNMQAYSIVVTTDKEITESLAPAHFRQQMVADAPVVLTFCADFNRITKWCEQRNAIPGYANFQSFITAAIDAMIVAQTFCIAAEDAGLGICYLGTTTYNAQEIIDVLDLPQLVVPITTVTLGYPSELPELTDRLPLEAIIHSERYKNYTPESIDHLYMEKEKLNANLKFINENNKETLAQVFTDIRYTKINNEFFSDKFLKTLRNQGFMN